ncbi:hypothetical protein ACE1TF_04015 [Geomicrobium sp. JSM 1781026]|uniref:hypothetical protein n=1 Tax=Geomicrobium sp. JSM 1781026 TaxID=3344580 RepID=UPI0035C1C982
MNRIKKILFFIPLSLLSACSLLGMGGTEFHTFEGISKAEFYHFEKYGGSGANSEVAILTEHDELQSLKSSLDKASDGVRVNPRETTPEYDMILHHEKGDTILHLIVGERGDTSHVMYAGYENEHFILPIESTEKIIDLIN